MTTQTAPGAALTVDAGEVERIGAVLDRLARTWALHLEPPVVPPEILGNDPLGAELSGTSQVVVARCCEALRLASTHASAASTALIRAARVFEESEATTGLPRGAR